MGLCVFDCCRRGASWFARPRGCHPHCHLPSLLSSLLITLKAPHTVLMTSHCLLSEWIPTVCVCVCECVCRHVWESEQWRIEPSTLRHSRQGSNGCPPLKSAHAVVVHKHVDGMYLHYPCSWCAEQRSVLVQWTQKTARWAARDLCSKSNLPTKASM